MDRQACRDLVVYYDAKIVWELFAKKSAECLNLRNSFITISSTRYVSLLGVSIFIDKQKSWVMNLQVPAANYC